MSNKEQFEKHVEELEQHFPGVPSIGCIGGSYGGQTVAADNSVAVIAMEGNLNVVTNVLEEASTMPVKYIGRLESDISKVGASESNTVCLDFCSGNDACVLTTIYSVLGKKHISLVGGLVTEEKYQLMAKFMPMLTYTRLSANNEGKIKVYKENIYKQVPDCRLLHLN